VARNRDFAATYFCDAFDAALVSTPVGFVSCMYTMAASEFAEFAGHGRCEVWHPPAGFARLKALVAVHSSVAATNR
jgi:hypothetical protein